MSVNSVDEDHFQLSGRTCLTHCGSPSHSTPCALWGMDRPRYTGREQRGLGKGVGGGRGSSTSLPGSGLAQVRSGP